jgi:hypothetical protein
VTINTDAAHLWEEIRASEDRRDQRLESLQDQIERYHGAWYKGDGPSEAETTDPENHAYEWLSSFIPQVLHDRPRVNVTSRRPGTQREVARALQAGINRWIVDSNFKDTLEELAYDYMFRWAVAKVSIGPAPGSYEIDDPLLMPSVLRLSPYEFGWDAMATHPKRARLFWHRWSIDKDDLISLAEEDEKLDDDDPERQGWNSTAIKDLVTGEPEQLEYRDSNHTVDRESVWLYDVYVVDDSVDDEKTPELGYNGTIRTLAMGGDMSTSNHPGVKVIRDPVDYFGPRGGGYNVYGCYIVPDQNEPLSPLVATQEQSDNLNAFVHQMIEDALASVNKVFMSGEDQKEADRINNAKHQQITLLDGPTADLQNRIANVKMGGVDPQTFPVAQWLRDILERVSGFNDVQKGNITGEGTATEVGFAVDASQARTEYMRGGFVDGAEAILRDVAHFMFHVDQVIFPLGEEGLEAAREDGQPELSQGTEAWFFGGTHGEGSGGTFQDLNLDIDLYSMVRTSEAALRRKSEVVINLLGSVYPVLLQPGIRSKAIIQTIANLENMPEILDFFDFEEMGKAGTGIAAPQLGRHAGLLGMGAGAAGLPAASSNGRTEDPSGALGSIGGLNGSSNGQLSVNI